MKTSFQVALLLLFCHLQMRAQNRMELEYQQYLNGTVKQPSTPAVNQQSKQGGVLLLAAPVKKIARPTTQGALLSGGDDSCCTGSGWDVNSYNLISKFGPSYGFVYSGDVISMTLYDQFIGNFGFHCNASCSSTGNTSYYIPMTGASGPADYLSFTPLSTGSFQVVVYGYCGTQVCDSIEFTIQVNCMNCPPGLWGSTTVFNATSSSTLPVSCGFSLDAMVNDVMYITSGYTCSFMHCDPSVTYAITSPSGYFQSGVLSSSGGVLSSINFAPTEPGCYTITLHGACGDMAGCGAPSMETQCVFTISVKDTATCSSCHFIAIKAKDLQHGNVANVLCGDSAFLNCDRDGFNFDALISCDSACVAVVRYQTAGTTGMVPFDFFPSGSGVFPVRFYMYDGPCSTIPFDSCLIFVVAKDSFCETNRCGDNDFESGVLNTADFDYFYGTVGNLVTGLLSTTSTYELPFTCMSCTGTPPPNLQVHHRIENVGDDLVVGPLLPRVHTGLHSMRLGNAAVNVGSESVRKVFTVTPGNSTLSFWYALVMGNPDVGSHSGCGIPTFEVTLKDVTIPGSPVVWNSLVNLSAGLNFISSSDPILSTTTSYPQPCGSSGTTEPMAYKPWTYYQMNLASLMGKTVSVEITTKDCGCCGHFCYAYLDGFCTGADSSQAGSATLVQGDTCGVNGHICVDYQLPFNATSTGTAQLTLNVYQGGGVIPVAVLNSPVLTAGSTYCFPVSSLPPAILSGSNPYFDFSISTNFSLAGVSLPPQIIGMAGTGQDVVATNDYHLHCSPICRNDTAIITISACDHYLWHGVNYTTGGVYHYVNHLSSGCDSVQLLYLTVNPTVHASLTVNACDSFVWYGHAYSSSGTYYHNGTTPAGCDSVVTLVLTILHAPVVHQYVTACDNYIWHGVFHNAGGMYTYTSGHACDTVFQLHLTLNPSVHITTSVSACNSYNWYGANYTSSGTYTHIGHTPAGCDSVVTLVLTILHPTITHFYSVACDSLVWHGHTYTASGIYSYNISGPCLSKEVLHLTIRYSVHYDVTVNACNSYTWYGTTYTTSGNYVHHGATVFGCDSSVTLHLTINTNPLIHLFASGCDQYIWHGVTYTSSGIYTYGPFTKCGPIYYLHLTINHSYHGSISVTACNSYTWYGTTYTTSGTYTHHGYTPQGCDSVLTLHLTVNHGAIISQWASACDSYTWHGTTYTSSGVYTYGPLTKCGTTYKLYLTIHPSVHITKNVINCGTYNWYGTNYFLSGTYVHMGHTPAGCDSVVTLNLTVNYSMAILQTVTACMSYTWFGTTYTTSGSYSYSPPGTCKTYFLKLTILTNCNTKTESSSVRVYPNPARDVLTVEVMEELPFDLGKMELRDLGGRVVLESAWQQNRRQELVITELPAGPYMLNLYNSRGDFIDSYRIQKE